MGHERSTALAGGEIGTVMVAILALFNGLKYSASLVPETEIGALAVSSYF